METLEGNKWRGGEDKMEMEEEGRGAIIFGPLNRLRSQKSGANGGEGKSRPYSPRQANQSRPIMGMTSKWGLDGNR